jgi:hypothetical protein
MNPPLKFVAIAFDDYGGIGFEFYSTVVQPYFEELREKEEAAGGSGWDARKKKTEFLQRVSITIAKGNSTPESSTACATICNLPPHQTWSLALCTTRGRTLAATSDPGTHATQRRPPQLGA